MQLFSEPIRSTKQCLPASSVQFTTTAAPLPEGWLSEVSITHRQPWTGNIKEQIQKQTTLTF